MPYSLWIFTASAEGDKVGWIVLKEIKWGGITKVSKYINSISISFFVVIRVD